MARQIIDVKAQEQKVQEPQKNQAHYGIWDVQGRVVLPGTREKRSVSPIRVVGADTREGRTKLSKDVAAVLMERYGKELPEGQKFSPHFAMMNLQWQRVQPKAKPAEPLAPEQEQAIAQMQEQAQIQEQPAAES